MIGILKKQVTSIRNWFRDPVDILAESQEYQLDVKRKKEQQVQKALTHANTLPRLTNKVKIACPTYNGSIHQCEVIVDVTDLHLWASDNVKHHFSCDETQVSRLALPIWTKNADLNDNSTSPIPADMYKF